MGTFHVKYDEIHAETAKMRRHLATDVVGRVQTEYRQIQSQIRQVDGAATAALIEAMNENCNKVVTAAQTMERLLSFMSNSARQIEASESQIARAFRTVRR